MTWTQLTLRLPGGISLELLTLHRPPRKVRPSLPPPPAVINTTGEPIADVVSLAEYRRTA